MSLYDTLRHFADSHFLLAIFAIFLLLVLWPFRPEGKRRSDEARTMIFKDETDGE